MRQEIEKDKEENINNLSPLEGGDLEKAGWPRDEKISPLLTDLQDTLHADNEELVSVLQAKMNSPFSQTDIWGPYSRYAGWGSGTTGDVYSQFEPGTEEASIHFWEKSLRQPRMGLPVQALGGGLPLGSYDFVKSVQYRQTNPISDLLSAAPKAISTALAQDFIQGIKTGHMDLGQTFIKLGYSAAQAMIQKFLENWLNQVVPLIANSFANVLSGGSSGGGGGGLFGWISGLFGGGSGSGSGVPFSNYLDLWSPSYSLPSSFLSAHGNVFSNGIELALANGGIVTRPTFFPMARGWGLMGEAGPEAVMPLTRTTGGALGVKAVTAQPQVNVVINNNTQAQVNAEQQGNGDLLISIDDAMAAAYQRRGRFYQALGQSRGITR